MFDNNPLPMWIYDTKSLEVLAVNTAATRHYGYNRQKFLAMNVVDLRHPDDPDTRDIARSVPAGINLTTHERHLRHDGTTIDVELTWNRLQFSGHEAIFVMAHDITLQKAAESRVRDQANLLNLTHDAIIAKDFKDRIQFWNRGAERLYGWTEQEAIGRSVEEILNIDAETFALGKIALLETGEWSGELVQKTREGKRIVVASRWTLVRNEVGDPKTVLIINTDITERKSLESQFRRAQQLEGIETRASGIAHDLNNILTPIGMSVSLLRRKIADDPNILNLLKTIEISAERGAGIVKQILSFARGAEGDRGVLQPRHLIGEIVKITSQTFPRNIHIRTSIPKDLWTLVGDAKQLHQVLLNLCVNARDAMPSEGGTITIGAENKTFDGAYRATHPNAKLGPHVVFAISDTGSGISPAALEKIFAPFFTSKEQNKGTGLGLSTVVGIVEGHGGFITVDSQPDKGTTFQIALPAKLEATRESAKKEANPIPRGNGELILVVDDEPSIREAASSTLTNAGYRVFTAEDGSDALALYSQRRDEIALVLTDLVMELMDGISLVRSMRRIDASVNVIVSSGQNGPEKREILKGLGVSSFLDKPFTAERMLRIVHSTLHSKVEAATAKLVPDIQKVSVGSHTDAEALASDGLEIEFVPASR
jgi:two-component system, cell cycle sensor histidine kinase and response regulator CckA